MDIIRWLTGMDSLSASLFGVFPCVLRPWGFASLRIAVAGCRDVSGQSSPALPLLLAPI
jgi:hypothetical protein